MAAVAFSSNQRYSADTVRTLIRALCNLVTIKGRRFLISTKQIHVFISHAWEYADHYNTLSDWIFNEKWSSGQASLDFRDFSVPRHDPIHNAKIDAQLRKALYNKIARSHVIVIPTGMYANYSKWIQKEIDGAKAYGKPILAVTPRGSQRISTVVSSAATKQVGWNKQSVVGGIWELYKS